MTDPPVLTYWEACYVGKEVKKAAGINTNVSCKRDAPRITIDEFSISISQDRCQAFAIVGEMRFYCMDDSNKSFAQTGDIGGRRRPWTPKAPWHYDIMQLNCGGLPYDWRAGMFMRTQIEPPFWSGSPRVGPVRHHLQGESKCCGDRHDYVRGSASPLDPMPILIPGGF